MATGYVASAGMSRQAVGMSGRGEKGCRASAHRPARGESCRACATGGRTCGEFGNSGSFAQVPRGYSKSTSCGIGRWWTNMLPDHRGGTSLDDKPRQDRHHHRLCSGLQSRRLGPPSLNVFLASSRPRCTISRSGYLFRGEGDAGSPLLRGGVLGPGKVGASGSSRTA